MLHVDKLISRWALKSGGANGGEIIFVLINCIPVSAHQRETHLLVDLQPDLHHLNQKICQCRD